MRKMLLTCSYLGFNTRNGSPVSARTMDGISTRHTHLKILNKGEAFHSENGQMSWTSKYGCVGFSPLQKLAFSDAMNTEGLSVSGLGDKHAVYQIIPEGKASLALSVNDLATFVLGTCKSTQEVKDAVQSHYVTDSLTDREAQLKLAFNDARGNQLFVEYQNGKPVFREINTGAGILTENGGARDQIQSRNASEKSRFERLTRSFQQAVLPQNSEEGRNLAWRLLRRVEILPGEWTIRLDGKDHNCYTQYSLVRDNKNKIFAWTTYDHLEQKKIRLDKINFEPGTLHPPALI